MFKIFKLKFRQDLKLEFGQFFSADFDFVEVLKLNLGPDSEARFWALFSVVCLFACFE